MRKDSRADIGRFLGLDHERNGTELIIESAEDMMLNCSGSGHPVFRGSSALERGDLKSKGNGKLSFVYISLATTKPLKWFVARSFPSISSVSTEL